MSLTRRVHRVAWCLLLTLALPLPAASRQDPDLDEILRRVGAYLADYERRIPGVVSQEDYLQEATFTPLHGDLPTQRQRRRLKSDVAVIAVEHVGWASFRDVYEVDGEPVRDRDDRLTALFLKPLADALDQARRITTEGTRYNANVRGVSIGRTINNPMLALRFFRADNQSRSGFTLKATEVIDGVRLMVVGFEEQAIPRLIQSPDDAAASGLVWIEPESGRVVRTELVFKTYDRANQTAIRSTVRGQFAPAEVIDLWVPASMDEEHRIESRGATARISGRATYSNIRTFRVEVGTIIKED